jgi:hypothetical protein
MTTERRGLFVMRTDESGTRCDAGCPRWHETPPDGYRAYHSGEWCDEFGAMHGARSAGCIQAEQDAREAEIEAVRRGHDIGYEGGADLIALDAELARIR